MANFTPAKFLKVVDKVYGDPNRPLPVYKKRDLVHTDIFKARRKYKMFHIITFDMRNIRVQVEYLNNFVRVYVQGNDTGSTGWTAEMLENFSLGLKAAQEILDECKRQGANKLS